MYYTKCTIQNVLLLMTFLKQLFNNPFIHYLCIRMYLQFLVEADIGLGGDNLITVALA